MALMKWDPFTVLTRLDTTFDDLMRRNFGSAFSGASGGASGTRRRQFMPGVDMATDGADVVISTELPGVGPDDIDIEVAGGVLTISGERKDTVNSDTGRVLVRELRYGSFQRSFRLPAGVDADRVTAQFDNGVLKLRVTDVTTPVTPARKIAVRSDVGTPAKQIEGEATDISTDTSTQGSAEGSAEAPVAARPAQ